MPEYVSNTDGGGKDISIMLACYRTPIAIHWGHTGEAERSVFAQYEDLTVLPETTQSKEGCSENRLFTSCMVTGTGSKQSLDIEEERLFHCQIGQTLSQVAQRGSGLSIVADIWNETGCL